MIQAGIIRIGSAIISGVVGPVLDEFHEFVAKNDLAGRSRNVRPDAKAVGRVCLIH